MIKSLTSFRFITAFIVFLFHCQIHFGYKLNIKILDKFIYNGATFMTGFFVLSGFIMAHVYNNTDFSNRKNIFSFYLKRFAKIYPTYAVATIVYFSVFHDFSSHQYLRIAANDLFLVQGFFPSMFQLGINGGTWSLTVEMFLYFLFPFLIILSSKSPKILIIAILFALIASFNVSLEKADTIYSNPIFRVSDFMCGMGFYFLCHKFKNIKLGRYLHILTIILLFFACKSLGKDGQQYMLGQFVIAPLFGLWIVMVFHSKSKLYNNIISEYLGLISYSFYLWQFVAISLGKELVKLYPDLSLYLVALVAFLANLCISALSYHLFEERVRKFILAKFGIFTENKSQLLFTS